MTKILYVPTGEFILFLTSLEYDKAHSREQCGRNSNGNTINYEESYGYSRGRSVEDMIGRIMSGESARWSGRYPTEDEAGMEFSREEFEIIYD